MPGENQQEYWQVEVGGQIYDAVLAELPDWINEGSLLPSDKIRKGRLRWIEARMVPALVPFFNAKEKGEPLPVVQTYTKAGNAVDSEVISDIENKEAGRSNPADRAKLSQPPIVQNASAPNPGNSAACCSIHLDTPAFYVCGSCGGAFCKACPKSFGGEVKICPNCDSLCKTIGQAAEAQKRATSHAASAAEGFGTADFFRAMAHPFRFKPSLIFGAVMFMFFTLGQSASGIGGIFMVGASIFCVMLANMLTFGVLANTVQNFTQGRLDADLCRPLTISPFGMTCFIRFSLVLASTFLHSAPSYWCWLSVCTSCSARRASR